MQRSSTAGTTRSSTEDQLVRDHLSLVHYAVSEMAARVPRHVCRDDLVSAAMLGLAQAARSFDESQGVTFARYARSRIGGALLDELRSRDWASRSVRSRARTLQETTDRLTLQLSRRPTSAELARELDVEPHEIDRLADDVHRATVLNYEALIVDGEGATDALLPSSGPAPEEVLAVRERTAYLVDAVVTLPERLRAVVVGYFFEERQMSDLAEELGVTESRISQMRAEALALLRDGINANLEPDLVDDDARPTGRVARRKAAYYAAVASASDFRTRLDAERPPIQQRIASSAIA